MISLVILAGFWGPLAADPPAIGSLTPRGGQRGQKVVLVIDGANLAENPELLIPLGSACPLITADPYKPTANRVAFELPLTAIDAPGPYQVRIRTDEGISAPQLFLVGVFPEAAETEPNDVVADAKPIQYPVTINGNLGATDRDTFKIGAKAGQRLTLEVEARRIGSAIDPTLHVLAANGRELAMSEDARGLGVDCRLEYVFLADGDYLVQVHDAMYLGQAQSFYRLKIGPITYADGVFPLGGRRGSEIVVSFEGGNLSGPVLERVRLEAPPSSTSLPVGLPAALDTAGTLPFLLRLGELPEVLEAARSKPDEAQAVLAPVTVNGRLEKAGEIDRYAFAVKQGQKWTFEVEAHALGSLMDGVLAVSNPQGGRLAGADDNGPNPDPRLEFAVPQGLEQVVVSIEDLHRRGGPGFAYRLTAKESAPDFLLSLATSTVSVPLQGTEIVAVDVVRRGYNGPVRLEVVGAPLGMTVRGGTVAAGQAKGYLSLSAPAQDRFRSLDLVIRGFGEGSEPTLARGTMFLANDRGMPVSPMGTGVVKLAVARALPVVLQVEDGPVRIPLGQTRPVKIRAVRADGGEAALKVVGVFAPQGVTIGEGAIAEKAGEGTVPFVAAPNAPMGEGEAAVRAVVKIGGKDVSVTAPVLAAAVVPPFTLGMARPAVEGPVGGMVTLEGEVRREAPFAGDVELKVEGMPAGVTATAVIVPGAQPAFKVALACGAEAKPGKVDLKLVASTKLGDPKNPVVYAAPPVAFSLSLQPPVKADAAVTAGGATGEKAAGEAKKDAPK